MSQIDEKTRLIILAKLANGEDYKDVAEQLDIGSGHILRLAKQLKQAQDKGAVQDLFRLPEDRISFLMEAVKNSLLDQIPMLDEKELSGEIDSLSSSVRGLGLLEADVQECARLLVTRIKMATAVNTEVGTLYTLVEALTKIQSAFFGKGTVVNLNNISGDQFGRYLRD